MDWVPTLFEVAFWFSTGFLILAGSFILWAAWKSNRETVKMLIADNLAWTNDNLRLLDKEKKLVEENARLLKSLEEIESQLTKEEEFHKVLERKWREQRDELEQEVKALREASDLQKSISMNGHPCAQSTFKPVNAEDVPRPGGFWSGGVRLDEEDEYDDAPPVRVSE